MVRKFLNRRVRGFCDAHTFGLGIWLWFEPHDDLVLAITVACFVVEVTVISQEDE